MKLPKIINAKYEDDKSTIILSIFIPSEIIYFSGHFENSPVLPGIVQLDWTLHFANEYLGIKKEDFLHIEQMKFARVITPGNNVFLRININENRLTFKYYNQKENFSNGKLKAKK